MKNTIYFIAFVTCFCFMYLLITIFGWILSDYTFKECLQSYGHIGGSVCLYWYCPFVFVKEDLDDIL